jgi:hypothetical protein
LSDKILHRAFLSGVGNARGLLGPVWRTEWGNGHTRIDFLGDEVRNLPTRATGPQLTNVDEMVCLSNQLTVWKNSGHQCPHPKIGGEKLTSILDAIFLQHAMRPIAHTPHNLDTTRSRGNTSIYRILFFFLVGMKVKAMLESMANGVPSFAMWVT